MKIKKLLILGITALSLGTVGIISQPTTSKAMSIYNPDNPFWSHSHWVTTTKRIVVHKIKCMVPEYKSYQVASYTVPSGSHYKISASPTNYHWFFDSGKFKSNKRYMYISNKSSHNWFKFGIHNYPTYRTLKTNNFYFDKYIPGFLNAGNTATVYTTPEDAINQTGKSYHLINIYQKMLIKWNNGNYDDVLKIKYDGNTFYYNDKNGIFQPYNTFRDKDSIDSPYSPNSKSKIYLKHGNQIHNGTRWDKVTTYNGGLLISDSYKLKNDRWVKIN